MQDLTVGSIPSTIEKDKEKKKSDVYPGLKSQAAYLHSALFPGPSMFEVCLLRFTYKCLLSLCNWNSCLRLFGKCAYDGYLLHKM